MFPNIENIVIAAVIAFFIGFGVGYNECNKKFIDFKNKVNTIAEVKQQEVAKEEKKSRSEEHTSELQSH